MDASKLQPITKMPGEAVVLTPNDLSLTPKRLSGNKAVKLGGGWIWCFSDDPNVPPMHFQRGFDGEAGLHGGDIQMGVGPLSKNTILPHSEDAFPTGLPLPYREVKGDPEGKSNDDITYEMTAENPKVLWRFSTKSVHFVESDYIDITFDLFPYAFIMPLNGMGEPYIVQIAEAKGTYGGKNVTFLGGFDRTFQGAGWDYILKQKKFATHMFFAGIHPDGTREYGFLYVYEASTGGFYCKDGEEPIVSSEVKTQAMWETLPHADDNAQVLTKATFEFGGKKINYQPKWGWRGHGEKYINGGPCGIPGFSQTSGVWYEGDTPYEFDRGIYI